MYCLCSTKKDSIFGVGQHFCRLHNDHSPYSSKSCSKNRVSIPKYKLEDSIGRCSLRWDGL